MALSEPLIELEHLGFGYGERDVFAGVDFALSPGERVVLTGPNGSGKTSLMHLMVGLLKPTAGRIIVFGEERQAEADFVDVRARVGLLFQDSDDQLFCPTVLEDVAFGPLNLGRSPEQARADAEETLATLGLDGFGERVAHRLSGGERRLVALATVLAMRPDVLLLDEPTTGLDEATERRLINHLVTLNQAMVIITHERPVIDALATRRLSLTGGRLLPVRKYSRELV